MKVSTQTRIEFMGETPSGFTTMFAVRHANRGEPYREGIELSVTIGDDTEAQVFLEEREARELRNVLNRLYPVKP